MDDLISRAAALEAYSELYCIDERLLNFRKELDEVFDKIKELPSAETEDCSTCKHGYFGSWQCDNCRVRYPSHYERRADEGSD